MLEVVINTVFSGEELIQQTGKNHGIANIRDEELVEADYPGFVGDIGRNLLQRVFLSFKGIQILMYALHKTVEMGAKLVFKRQAIIEDIHQVSLAPTYTAPEINPVGNLLGLRSEQRPHSR